MAPGATGGRVEPQNHPEQGHGIHLVLPGLWCGCRPPHGPGIRVAQSQGYDEGTNQRAREDSLDQLDEARTVALMQLARYQQALRWYQAQKIWRRDFNEGT
jgi:hypothetical protein